MVGSTGCTSLVFPMVAVHNIHSLFGNDAIASGLKRAGVRFPGRVRMSRVAAMVQPSTSA